jgi:hypothetical protein
MNKILLIVVPMDLDVKMKGLTLGALFLIVGFRFETNNTYTD